MARPKKVTASNVVPMVQRVDDPELQADIRSYLKLEAERAERNADMAALRTKHEARGIDKRAFQRAVSDSKLAPEVREAMDVSYGLVRKAAGVAVQGDMFGAAARISDAAPVQPDEPQQTNEAGATAH